MSLVTLYVRPFAYRNESLLGYLLRLGKINGLNRTKHLVELFDLGSALKLRAGAWELSDQQKVYREISEAIGRCDMAAFTAMANDAQRFPSNQDASIGSTRIPQPRVCLKCMQSKKPYLPWYWQSIFVSHCPTHRTRLISECPNPDCGQALAWEPTIHNGCTHCGCDWTDMNRGYDLMAPTTELEQRVVNGLIDGADPDASFYEDLSRAMMLVARSFDFMSDRLSAVPESPDISKIINAAYWLITSVNFEIFYKNVKYLELGGIAVFPNQPIPSLDCFQFHSVIAQDAYGSEEIEPEVYAALLQFDDPAFISKRRQRVSLHEADQARFHVDGKALSSLFGRSEHIVPILLEEQALTALNSARSDRDKIFDASELMRCVKQRLTDTVPVGYLKVHPWSPSLKEHCNDYVRLLGWVLSGQLEGYLVPDSGFKVLYLSLSHLLFCRESILPQSATTRYR